MLLHATQAEGFLHFGAAAHTEATVWRKAIVVLEAWLFQKALHCILELETTACRLPTFRDGSQMRLNEILTWYIKTHTHTHTVQMEAAEKWEWFAWIWTSDSLVNTHCTYKEQLKNFVHCITSNCMNPKELQRFGLGYWDAEKLPQLLINFFLLFGPNLSTIGSANTGNVTEGKVIFIDVHIYIYVHI